MKIMSLSFIAASALSLSFLGLNADQDVPQSEVPSVVVNAVSTAHPSATNIDWEKEKEVYEAEFDIDTKEYTVQVSNTGQVIQTKYDVVATELPQTITSVISGTYNNYKIDDVEMVEKDGRKYYQVELEATLKSKQLVFDEAGKELTSMSYWD